MAITHRGVRLSVLALINLVGAIDACISDHFTPVSQPAGYTCNREDRCEDSGSAPVYLRHVQAIPIPESCAADAGWSAAVLFNFDQRYKITMAIEIGM